MSQTLTWLVFFLTISSQCKGKGGENTNICVLRTNPVTPFSSLKLSYTYEFFMREQNGSSKREEEGNDYLEVKSGSLIEDP